MSDKKHTFSESGKSTGTILGCTGSVVKGSSPQNEILDELGMCVKMM